MKNLAAWPWSMNEVRHGNSRSIMVTDADRRDLCQVYEYKDRPGGQAIENAVLFAASRTMLKMIEDSDGTNDRAVMRSLRDLVDMCKRLAAGHNRPDIRDLSPNAPVQARTEAHESGPE